MSRKIKRNIRLSTELLDIIKELSDIMRNDIYSKQNTKFITYRKFNSPTLLEHSIMRGIPHYISLSKDTCDKYHFEDITIKINHVQERLNEYIKNITYYNKSINTIVKTIPFDPDIRDSIEKLAEANSIFSSMDINFSDVFKLSLLKGIYHVIDDSKKLCNRFNQTFPDIDISSINYQIINEKLENKNKKINLTESKLYNSDNDKKIEKKEIQVKATTPER